MKNVFVTIIMVVLVWPLASCSGVEVMGEGAMQANRGNNLYARGRFEQASRIYQQFVEQNPDSPFRKEAIMGLADAKYKNESFFEATLYYERFLELYPLDKLTPRAVFYLGMCHYHETQDSDRDQVPSYQTLDTFKLFLQRFHGHDLASFAKKYILEMEEKIAEAELSVARYYARVNKRNAAISRLKNYIIDRPGAAGMAEAKYLLGESYYYEQAYKKAGLMFAEVIRDYPNNDFAGKAVELANKLKIKN